MLVEAFREAQLLLLIVVFLLAGIAKLVSRESTQGVVLACVELTLCGLLVLSAHPLARLVTIMTLAAATWILGDLRTRRPDDGCGCFGSLSNTPIGRRTVVRTGLLAVTAMLTWGVPDPGLRVMGDALGWRGAIFVAEFVFFLVISPEPLTLVRRTRVACERRAVPLEATLNVLHDSAQWRDLESIVAVDEPSEVWREQCWRFLVYPGFDGTEAVDVVFAVSLDDRTVRAALVEGELSNESSDTGPNPLYAMA